MPPGRGILLTPGRGPGYHHPIKGLKSMDAQIYLNLSPWWLLTLPAYLLLAAGCLKLGARLTGARVGLGRAVGAVAVSIPAGFLSALVGGLVAGPAGGLILPLAANWAVFKAIGRLGWLQALVALIIASVLNLVFLALVAFITGLGLMELLKQTGPPEVEVFLRSLPLAGLA